jgi:hypothetical protein
MKLGRCAGVVVLLVLIAGCGKGKLEKTGVTVKGTVLNNGQPITFLKDEIIMVSLSPPPGSGGKGSGGSTEVNPDGSFVLAGPNGTGVTPGSYQVQLSSSTYGGGGEDRFARMFPGANAPANLKPILVEIGAEDGQTIVVDVGKRTATKQ